MGIFRPRPHGRYNRAQLRHDWIGTRLPPVNTVPPAVTGTTVVGQTLSTTDGTWTGSPASFTYQWQRDDHGGGSYSNIGGATANTYVLVDADDQCRVRCVVTATGGGSASANSNAVGLVTEPVPANTVAPAVTGSAIAVGVQLSCGTGTWNNMAGYNPSYGYQWQSSADGISGWANIGGATSATYTPVSGDIGSYLRCVVTATNSGGSAAANSAARGPVLSVVPILAFGTGLIGPPPKPEVTYLLLRPGRNPLRLIPVAKSLRFSTLAVGGFGSASLTLPGPPSRWHNEIPHLSRLVVTSGGRIVYEGQVEDIAKKIGKSETSTTLQCFGLRRRLNETSVKRIWSKRDLTWEDQPYTQGHPGAWTFSQGRWDPADLSKSGPYFTGTNTATCDDGESRRAIWWAPSGIYVRKCYLGWNRDGSTSFRAEFGYYNSAGNYTKVSNQGASLDPVTVSFPADTAAGLSFGVEINAVTYLPTAADRGKFWKIRALCTSLDEDYQAGNQSGFYGGTILRDLLALVPDLQVGTIEAGSDFAIPAIERFSRSDADSIVREVAGYYGREWAVWEDGRFDWVTPALDQPQWIIPVADLDDLEISSSVADVARTVYLVYDDAAIGRDAEQSASSTDQRNPYVKQAKTKDLVAPAGFPMTSDSASQLAAKLAADNGGYPTVTGRITLPVGMLARHAYHGPVSAMQIRAGENILVPDLPKTDPNLPGRDGETLFHIVSTDYDEGAQKIALEVEGFTKRGDQLLARLAAVTRRVTG